MRTKPARRPAPPARLRAPIQALRRRLAELDPRVRWGLAAALLAALVALGYQATVEPVGYDWLMDGRPFSRAEAGQVAAALRDAGIPCTETGGQIGVPADRKAEALAELARHKLGPRQLNDVLAELAQPPSILWDFSNREKRELFDRGTLIQTAISKLSGVLSATAVLTPVDAGTPLHPIRQLRATVFVQAEPGQVLPSQTVQFIRVTVRSLVSELEPDGLTLIDPWADRIYAIAGRPEAEILSAVKAREEEIRAKILDQLRIEGARVTVRIDPGPPPAASPRPEEPALVVNTPIDGGQEAEAMAPSATSTPSRASILVRVPRDYLYRLYESVNPGDAPSASDLIPYDARTREIINTIVGTVLSPTEQPELAIDWIDSLGPTRPSPPSNTEARRAIATWLPLTAAGVLAVLGLMALGGGLIAARRPAARLPERSLRRDPFEAGVGDDAGPGERVRELIRLDPAAAAGILHRWIAQGGRTA